MAGRRPQPPRPVAVISLGATNDPAVDRVLKQAEQHVEDLQDHARRTSAAVETNTTDLANLTSTVTALPTTGRLLRAPQTLTGSGTYTPAIGTAMVIISGAACGGGGGGAGAAVGTTAAAGGGGASGERVSRMVIGAPGGSLITGGSFTAPTPGGAAGANTGGNGGTGSDATLLINGVTYTLKGGGGGQGMASTTVAAFAKRGVAQVGAVTGAIREDGWPGVLVNTSSFWGGPGGSAGDLGEGGAGADALSGSTAGGSPSGFGGGGGGGCAFGNTGVAGAAGGPAGWIIEEYS